jgi:hypothetical protein
LSSDTVTRAAVRSERTVATLSCVRCAIAQSEARCGPDPLELGLGPMDCGELLVRLGSDADHI